MTFGTTLVYIYIYIFTDATCCDLLTDYYQAKYICVEDIKGICKLNFWNWYLSHVSICGSYIKVKVRRNAILITRYTPCDKERMRFSSCTSHKRWLATMATNRSWRIIGWRIIKFYCARRKTCPNVTSSITNATLTGFRLKPSRQSERLYYAMALSQWRARRVLRWCNMHTHVHTGCFTTLRHNCRRWFPRFLWSKKFI